ncbi:MAG: tetratricopeptide repeat protein, partial [Candidatus Marinimicrobia bacterium]|nr:tetratricopeptide repeat protein [Candidatus Neomarinimicrobiota bacterium]
DLSDNAKYWIGESYFGIGNYTKALSAFEVVLTYPQSNKNDYAQFKIGLCLLKLKKEPQAYAAFQSFIDSYPESELMSRVIVLRDRIQ